MDAGVDVDLYPVELHTGDRVLLCSDGLTSMIRPDEIASILRRERDPQAAANKLVDAANAAGGEDNITVVILDAAEGDAVPAVAEREVIGDAEAPAPRKERQRRLAGTTRVVKVLLWVLPVILVIALAFGAVGWYARRTYYVTIDDRRVTVFKGVPGGLLGWDPTLEERTSLRASDLTEAERSDLEDEKRFSSRDKADEFVDRLQRKVDDREEAATTSTTTVTTTVPPPSAPSP
jgi:protein phosphatase